MKHRYYLYGFEFKSPLSTETLHQKLNDLVGDTLLLDKIPESKDSYRIECGDTIYGDDYDMARLLSTVINIDSYALIELGDEDEGHERFGYLVFHTNPFDAANNKYNIYEIDYKPTVDNKFIPEYAARYLKNLQPKKRQKKERSLTGAI